jgi:hypothetical protein
MKVATKYVRRPRTKGCQPAFRVGPTIGPFSLSDPSKCYLVLLTVPRKSLTILSLQICQGSGVGSIPIGRSISSSLPVSKQYLSAFALSSLFPASHLPKKFVIPSEARDLLFPPNLLTFNSPHRRLSEALRTFCGRNAIREPWRCLRRESVPTAMP